jgi:hypothetical protein
MWRTLIDVAGLSLEGAMVTLKYACLVCVEMKCLRCNEKCLKICDGYDTALSLRQTQPAIYFAV